MSLSVGIVGLPNAGKSTLFNALLSRQIAPVANYPFTTINPYEGVVALPDERLAKLVEMVKPEKTTPATVTFIDIAGLVKNAHQGEGMGNQFLGKIREVEAVVQVVRAFENPDVPHYYQTIDPKRDAEIINLELELGGVKKPTIYVLNVDETQLKNPPVVLAGAIPICAKVEMELMELEPAERKEYLSQLGVNESGLEKIILAAYQILGLITFYTIKGGKEVRAWSLKSGATALKAAEVVHTDFEKNFIKAEVISFADFVQYQGWENSRGLGKVRSEGKDYRIADGEVVEFKVGV